MGSDELSGLLRVKPGDRVIIPLDSCEFENILYSDVTPGDSEELFVIDYSRNDIPL